MSILPALPQFISVLILGLVLSLMVVQCPSSAAKDDKKKEKAGQPVIKLSDKQISESSGLAVSRRKDNRFWTHNDSGDGPRLYAFDSAGKKTGQCRLPQATSVDWEDMASYVELGTARLAVADCGDNEAKRKSIFIYLFDEPNPDSVTQIDYFTKLELKYADGPQNCEAIGIDTKRSELVLLSKNSLPFAGLYRTALPQREGTSVIHVQATTKRSKTLAVPMITAMDIDDSNGDVWVGTYFDLFCFRCTDRLQPLDEQLGSMPKHVAMPSLKQIEALAVDSEHQIHVTSEGNPARMTRVVSEPQP